MHDNDTWRAMADEVLSNIRTRLYAYHRIGVRIGDSCDVVALSDLPQAEQHLVSAAILSGDDEGMRMVLLEEQPHLRSV